MATDAELSPGSVSNILTDVRSVKNLGTQHQPRRSSAGPRFAAKGEVIGRVFTLILFFVSAAITPAAWALDWDKPWISTDVPQITGASIEPLLQIAQKDPEAMDLLGKLMERTGIDSNNAELMAALFSFCKDNSVWGDADLIRTTQVAVKDEEGKVSPEISRSIRYGAALTEDRPGYQLWSTADCTACLRRHATLRETYNTFIHEIVHIAFSQPEQSAEAFLEAYPDASTYVQKRIGDAGGEIQAFVRATRSTIRVSGRKNSLPGSIDAYFDLEGGLVSQGALRRDLLENHNYAQILREDYFYKLDEFVELHALIRKLVERTDKTAPELKRLDALDARIRKIPRY